MNNGIFYLGWIIRMWDLLKIHVAGSCCIPRWYVSHLFLYNDIYWLFHPFITLNFHIKKITRSFTINLLNILVSFPLHLHCTQHSKSPAIFWWLEFGVWIVARAFSVVFWVFFVVVFFPSTQSCSVKHLNTTAKLILKTAIETTSPMYLQSINC